MPLALALLAALLLLAAPHSLAAIEGRSPGDGDRAPELANYCRYFSASPHCSAPFSRDDGEPVLFLVYFDPSDDALRSSEAPALKHALALARLEPHSWIAITGHADQGSNPEDQLDLSVRRAQRIADWLTERGVEQERISLSGAGATRLALRPQAASGEKLNRRVEILFDPY